MKNKIKKHNELIGKKVIVDNKTFTVTQAFGRIFHNPNVVEFHNKYVYSLMGIDDNGELHRVDTLEFKEIN